MLPMLASEALGIDLIEDTLYLLLVLLGVKLWHEFPANFGESKILFRFLFTCTVVPSLDSTVLSSSLQVGLLHAPPNFMSSVGVAEREVIRYTVERFECSPFRLLLLCGSQQYHCCLLEPL